MNYSKIMHCILSICAGYSIVASAFAEEVQDAPPHPLAYYLPKADAGDAEAQFEAGKTYLYGVGTAKDMQKAQQYFELSAKQNNPYAETLLAGMYQVGYGIPKNEKLALQLNQQAADQGYAKADTRSNLAYTKRVC